MQKIFAKTFEYFLDLIFPIHCLGCGKNREELAARERWICPDCFLKIMPRGEQVCPKCKEASEGGRTHSFCRGDNFLDGLWAAVYYDEFFERAVHDFKFKFIKEISYPLSELMVRSILETQEFGEFQDIVLVNYAKDEEEGIYSDEQKNVKAETILIPVPLHPKRYAMRGFNQSFLLAKNIGEKFALPVREDILSRTKNTKPQSKTSNKEERYKNIESAFLCRKPDEVKGINIIVVDDICTTSATLNECAKELKRCGAKNVWGWVVARK
ncbi:MAG: ComF family protein [Candidatus Pacebacteria bacterium]|jgi:ComF family protein|nr:ComF family protein [Candidatus Paceibacterota bacterium]